MQDYSQTQRTAVNVETGETYSIYTHNTTHQWILVNDSHTITNIFYIATYDIAIKLNTGKVIQLDQGDFYQFKQGERVTHRKADFHKRFQKV